MVDFDVTVIATTLQPCLRLSGHVPLPGYVEQSFAAVLPFYQLEKERDVAKAVKLVRAQIMNLQEYDWKKLVKVMEEVNPGASAFPVACCGELQYEEGIDSRRGPLEATNGWLIPARAGNLPEGAAPPGCLSVHPRTCGEHRAPSRWPITSTGSSPHVRGTYM